MQLTVRGNPALSNTKSLLRLYIYTQKNFPANVCLICEQAAKFGHGRHWVWTIQYIHWVSNRNWLKLSTHPRKSESTLESSSEHRSKIYYLKPPKRSRSHRYIQTHLQSNKKFELFIKNHQNMRILQVTGPIPNSFQLPIDPGLPVSRWGPGMCCHPWPLEGIPEAFPVLKFWNGRE